jgi:hypothetical protein
MRELKTRCGEGRVYAEKEYMGPKSSRDTRKDGQRTADGGLDIEEIG